MATQNLVNIDSGNGLLPDGAKPLPEPIETVSPEGTFCDTVQVPSRGGDMKLI